MTEQYHCNNIAQHRRNAFDIFIVRQSVKRATTLFT